MPPTETVRSFCRVCSAVYDMLVDNARVENQTRPGTISVPHGYESANVSLLTDSREIDPKTGMARHSGLPVSVFRV